MYLTLLTLPLMTFACIALFGRDIGARGTIVLSVFSAVTCALISMLIFYEVALCRAPCQINLAPYFHSELFDANWGFLFDTLTAVMCVVVTLISCLVIIYSCSYMIEDPHFIRFISYLKLFTVAMLVLVTADNYIQLFVGWEAVGLASFLLISFWFHRLQASKAAIQAMLLNRVGDIALALGIICLFFGYKTTHYQALFACATDFYGLNFVQIGGYKIFNEPLALLDFACVLLFIGAMGKSGQFGQKGPKTLPFSNIVYLNDITKMLFVLESRYMLETSLKVLNPLPLKNSAFLFIKSGYRHLEKLQKHGNNQQENQYNKTLIERFIGFVEGDGCFYITEGKPIFQYICI
jgi:formate hydrogenlyase subunit 3/multisubunit Na+/H+ antiporter MnhD subunit